MYFLKNQKVLKSLVTIKILLRKKPKKQKKNVKRSAFPKLVTVFYL